MKEKFETIMDNGNIGPSGEKWDKSVGKKLFCWSHKGDVWEGICLSLSTRRVSRRKGRGREWGQGKGQGWLVSRACRDRERGKVGRQTRAGRIRDRDRKGRKEYCRHRNGMEVVKGRGERKRKKMRRRYRERQVYVEVCD